MSRPDYGEPLYVIAGCIRDREHRTRLDSIHDTKGEPRDIILFERRLVACANACAGMEDPIADIARLTAINAGLRQRVGLVVAGVKAAEERNDAQAAEIERLRAALERIRDLDYRGNRHHSADIASAALAHSVTKGRKP